MRQRQQARLELHPCRGRPDNEHGLPVFGQRCEKRAEGGTLALLSTPGQHQQICGLAPGLLHRKGSLTNRYLRVASASLAACLKRWRKPRAKKRRWTAITI
jgi:hypothetical protein